MQPAFRDSRAGFSSLRWVQLYQNRSSKMGQSRICQRCLRYECCLFFMHITHCICIPYLGWRSWQYRVCVSLLYSFIFLICFPFILTLRGPNRFYREKVSHLHDIHWHFVTLCNAELSLNINACRGSIFICACFGIDFVMICHHTLSSALSCPGYHHRCFVASWKSLRGY